MTQRTSIHVGPRVVLTMGLLVAAMSSSGVAGTPAESDGIQTWTSRGGHRSADASVLGTEYDRETRDTAVRGGKAGKEAGKRRLPPLPRPTTLTLNVEGVERSALLYPGLNAHAVPSPILLYFHGFTGTSQDSAERTKFHEL